ncbi:MAG: hypothetical protein QOK31_1301 [Solirubrobacteraceae bacterium]|nr:hypothetical protein [Solirubrobacteraceae bacterium]
MAHQGLTREARPAGLAELFDELEATAERAADAVGGFEDIFVRVAGLAVRLRFAGPALMPRLAPSLAHLACDPVDVPALTVRLFDGMSTSTDLPPLPWGEEAYRDNGRVHARVDGELVAIFEPRTFSVWRQEARRGLYWIGSPAEVHYAETGSPLLRILSPWLASRGIQFAHGGAVGDPDGCVLIVGRGGAGKSSTVLACLQSDLALLGDDYCLLGPENPPVVHSIYSAAKTHADTLERLPFLAPMVSNPDRPDGDKALCFLAEHAPGKLLQHAPLRALALPRISGRRETVTEPAPRAAVLGALAPSTLFQLASPDPSALARIGEVVRSVPCHYLDVGTDAAQIPPAVRSLVRA